MSQQTRATLKTFYETDDQPTQAQFGDFIDSDVNIQDDGILVSGTDAITAFAGGGQGSATPLTTKVNRVTTVASPADSVLLPSAVAGMTIYIENSGANSMDVFPQVGQVIAGLGVNNPLAVAAATTVILASPIASGWIHFNTF